MASAQNERLAHYLNLARNAPVEAATQICQSATADPQLYVFSELLNAPEIARLQNTPSEKYFRLLRLFAYGTVSDFRENATDLPPLSDGQKNKLRLLTLVSLSYGKSHLSYSAIREGLDLSDDVEVERMLREAVYAGLLRCRMDQRDRSVEILFAVGRDVIAPEGVSQMVTLLKSWVTRSAQLVDEIDKKIGFIGEQTSIASTMKSTAAARAESVRQQVEAEQRQVGGRDGHYSEIGEYPDMERLQQASRRHPPRRAVRNKFGSELGQMPKF